MNVMAIHRSISAVLLAIVLAVTGVAMSVARADMVAAGEIYCIDGGAVAVLTDSMGLPLLDADGQPITAHDPLCPDCLIGALAILPTPDLAAASPRVWPLDVPTLALAQAGRVVMGGNGRGPPVGV